MPSTSADICERLQESTHIFRSSKEDWSFPGKNCQKLECFCILLGCLRFLSKIRLGEIFSRKAINFVKRRDPQIIQLERIQLIS